MEPFTDVRVGPKMTLCGRHVIIEVRHLLSDLSDAEIDRLSADLASALRGHRDYQERESTHAS